MLLLRRKFCDISLENVGEMGQPGGEDLQHAFPDGCVGACDRLSPEIDPQLHVDGPGTTRTAH
jgi:hypothetical protein